MRTQIFILEPGKTFRVRFQYCCLYSAAHLTMGENKRVIKYLYEKKVYKLSECSAKLAENMYCNSYISISHVYSHLGWRSIYQWHS